MVRGPLSNLGSGLKEGDYLLAVNGRDLRAPQEPDEVLAGLTSEVTLTIASDLAGPRRNIKVHPFTDHVRLRRHDWIEQTGMK